jgi:hypothetical protein
VVRIGEAEAFRTLEAFASKTEASEFAQRLMGDALGDLLAGREWRQVRDEKGATPTRQDYHFSALPSGRLLDDSRVIEDQ